MSSCLTRFSSRMRATNCADCSEVCCSVFVAVCCSVLQHDAVCHSVLQGVAVCCNVCVAICLLQCVAVYLLQYDAVCCSLRQHVIVLGAPIPREHEPRTEQFVPGCCRVLQCICCSALQCVAVCFSVLHLATQYTT